MTELDMVEFKQQIFVVTAVDHYEDYPVGVATTLGKAIEMAKREVDWWLDQDYNQTYEQDVTRDDFIEELIDDDDVATSGPFCWRYKLSRGYFYVLVLQYEDGAHVRDMRR